MKYIDSKKQNREGFIDKWYPSSKTCHVCGAVQALNLRDLAVSKLPHTVG